MQWISLFKHQPEHGSPRTGARFSENQSAPKLENRKTSPVLHVLPSRMVGLTNHATLLLPRFFWLCTALHWWTGYPIDYGAKKCPNNFSRPCPRYGQCPQEQMLFRGGLPYMFVTERLTDVLISESSEHCRVQSCPRDMWPFLQLIKVIMRRPLGLAMFV